MIQTILSALSLIVALVAAIYSYLSPLRAVEKAETLRQKASEREKKVQVFTALMAERGRWSTPLAINALNSTKIVFQDAPEVLKRWFLMNSAVSQPDTVDTRHFYFDLVEAMSDDLGLRLRREDIEQFFASRTDDMEQRLRGLQLQQAFNTLTSTGSEAKG